MATAEEKQSSEQTSTLMQDHAGSGGARSKRSKTQYAEMVWH
jgi:hypothetical protein